MAKMLVLRWTPITTNSGIWFDSNLVILNGTSGVQIEMPLHHCHYLSFQYELQIEMKGNGNDVTAFQSMTGNNFVTCFQDYFGDIWDKIIPHPGIGQVIKFRVNRLPDYACIRGDIEDGGDVDPENPDVPMNAFCGSEGEPFRDIDSEFLLGRQRAVINP